MYDKHDPISIEEYGKLLEGRRLRDILTLETPSSSNKGGFGALIESYFGIPANCEAKADFQSIGGAKVELKTLPLIKNSKGTRAKERMVFNIIDYMSICDETWEDSSFLNKNSLILLVAYWPNSDCSPLDFKIEKVRLLDLTSLPSDDYKIMIDDWNQIVTKIRLGNAHELSEGDTLYLGACTKGSTAEKSLREQPFSRLRAKQRAFSWKQSYLNSVILHILGQVNQSSESAIKNFATYTGNFTFEQIILNCFNQYIGHTEQSLCDEFNVSTMAKNRYALIAKKILGLSDASKNIAEFEKANILMKTIRVNENSVVKESMSFPTFKYCDIINQEWDESDFKADLERKFFFVVFENKENIFILKKVMFWNMPSSLLDGEVKAVWEKAKIAIINGDYNNLPKSCESPIAHVRPHARNAMDTYPTPQGGNETKKCFWLNNTFIAEQIK